MIRRLRLKFILIALASVAAVLAIIMSAIFAVNYRSVTARADAILDVLSSNMGRFPRDDFFRRSHRGFNKNFTPETPYETRFFSVTLDSEYNIVGMNTGAISAIDSDSAVEYCDRALKKGERGFLDNYRFKKSINENEILFVFVDCTRDLDIFKSFVVTGAGVSILGLILVLVLIFIFSKPAVAPAEASIARQKRFITDASHEIKTPLTVIDASLDVIEMESGESHWINNAKQEIVRLKELCESLVEMSRIDEKKDINTFEAFDLSDVVVSAALVFEAPLESKGRRLVLDVPEGIKLNGAKKDISRLVTLFVDNAVKYSSGIGDVLVRLRKNGAKTMLEIVNPVEGIPRGSHPEFFERFWRGDESRSKEKEGFGIGLSVAQSICEEHRAKISAESDEKFMTFRVIF